MHLRLLHSLSLGFFSGTQSPKLSFCANPKPKSPRFLYRILKMEVEMDQDDSSSGNTTVEFTFTAVEIDIDYEFEAARFFDFTREESIEEAREAEMWFDLAGSYPPSPFAVGLLSREQNENDGDVENRGVPLYFKNYCLQAFQNQQSTSTVLKESIKVGNDKGKTKAGWKPSFPRTSTLMKPTASQLAKQNKEHTMDNFRFQINSSGVESQASKRQKLERGHLCKGTDTNQQAYFVHKAPKREGNVANNLSRCRLRITVPRSPNLATAQRPHKIRQKDNSENGHVISRTPGFRARPLNRKIFEPPSILHQKSIPHLPEFQEFHLKTSERAVQNTKAPQKASFTFGIESGSRNLKGPQDGCEPIHRFKALPLNKKIFNFQTEKRAHHAPPVDLFNKLSLTSEPGSQSNRIRPPFVFSKGSKENRVQNLDQSRFTFTVKK